MPAPEESRFWRIASLLAGFLPVIAILLLAIYWMVGYTGHNEAEHLKELLK